MKKNIYSGENFKWLKLHIDELLMTISVTQGSQSARLNSLGRLIFLMAFYLKNETNMSYKKACMIIEKKQLEKLIEYEEVIVENEMIKIPLADKNWKRFISEKKAQSKGGKNKVINENASNTRINDEQEETIKKEYYLNDLI